MIILDTNVVIEPATPDADARVIAWLDLQDENELWLTAITAAELQMGVEGQSDDIRRAVLQHQVSTILDGEFRHRILPFDLDAAYAYARIAGPLLRSKRVPRTMDFQIAAIALVHGAAVATRNSDDFAGTGVEVINPWSA